MATIYLVIGGSRSGKSRYAQRLAETLDKEKIYLATCPVIDAEITERIKRHQNDRDDSWTTIEEQIDISSIIQNLRSNQVLLVDCLTLWVNNLLYHSPQMTEEHLPQQWEKVKAALIDAPGDVIFVTNEIGMGIVPETRQTRTYRDMVGRLNQLVAAIAHKVDLIVAGIPMTIKKHEKGEH